MGTLLEKKLMIILLGLESQEVFYLRKRYPYAWLIKDIPINWKEDNDMTLFKNLPDIGRRQNLSLLIRNGWKGATQKDEEIYNYYIKLLDEIPPLPNPIVLFRDVILSTSNLKIGGEYITDGFYYNEYLYSA